MKTILLLAAVVSSTAFAAQSAGSKYKAMKVPALRISLIDSDGMPMVGSDITEKSANGELCRKYLAVVPHPRPEYQCWAQIEEGSAARARYNSAHSAELSVDRQTLDGGPIVGAQVFEKGVGSDILCQKTVAVVPHAVPQYACFKQD